MPRFVAKRAFTRFVTAAKSRSISDVNSLVTLIRLAPDTVSACDLRRAEMLDFWREMATSEWAKTERTDTTVVAVPQARNLSTDALVGPERS
jgi:DNA-binding beta-propeller fold protein YncE